MPREQHEPLLRPEIAKHLASYTAQLVPALRILIEHEYPEDFWQLDFEVHEYYFDDFPVCVYFYREEFDQVADDEEGYPEGQTLHIIETGRIIPQSLLDQYPEDEAAGECWHSEAIDAEIVAWFHKCWIDAGGTSFPHRARLAPHDADQRMDLVTGEWTDDG